MGRIEESCGSVSIRTVETETFSMDYLRFGDGEKVFVILPGLSVQSVLTYAESIASMYKPFVEDYTVYLFDRRKDIPEKYLIHDMARDTAGAMRVLGLKNACVYGASQGGMIAMVLAIEYPDLVKKLVLASTASCVINERAGVIDNWIALAKARRAEDLYMAFGDAIYPARTFAGLRSFFSDAAGTVTAGELDRFVILANALKGFDVSDKLTKIHCPALVIGSRDDKVFGEEASLQIAEALPGAAYHMYDGYGHAVYDTAPDFVERILLFFRQQ